MMDIKICSKCKIEKYISDYAKRADRAGGLQSVCKACAKLYKTENKKRVLLVNKKYYEENKGQILLKNYSYNKEYHLIHKEEISERKKKYYIDNKDMILSNKRDNKEIVNAREKVRKQRDPAYKLRRYVSTLIFQALKKSSSSKKGNSILEYLFYTMEELKIHIAKQFEPWMTWNNHGKYDPKSWDDNDPTTWTWQLDHIIPQSKLPYISMTDDNFKKCWDLDNLRPLSAKQNVIDGASKIRHIK